MGRILAIDYGSKRVGLAVTDILRISANPLATVATGDILEFIERYFATNDVDLIVVGKPQRMNGDMSMIWPAIEKFVEELGKKTGCEIKFEDERFTSKMASAAIAQSGLPRNKRQDKGLIDRTSAVIILQSFMERGGGNPGCLGDF